MKHQPVILVIFDGWGIRQDAGGNPIAEVRPDRYFQLLENYPNLAIHASGRAVGLPEGLMGNSDVGHLNIGAGRVVKQDVVKIDDAIADGSFFRNPVFLDAFNHVKTHQSTLHLMGLVSPGGVHSQMSHLWALLKTAKENGIENLRVHAFLDGRDVPPRSAEDYLHQTEQVLNDLDLPQIATLNGRYFAMDRDTRWDRTEKAYNNLVLADGPRYLFSLDALDMAYTNGENDEFVTPCVCDMAYDGMHDGDAILFFNFRADRARQITRAFVQDDFDPFPRQKKLNNLYYAGMSTYDKSLELPAAYPKGNPTQVLAEVLSNQGLRQFHTAETEKYAHVTYFLNGGREQPFPGEDRKMIPSPKVATYDLQPEMNLPLVTEAVVGALESGQYDFIVTNFANPDMVGHTGMMDAAKQAVEEVNRCLGEVVDTALSRNWVLLLTADHGNIEKMVDDDGGPHTAHTTALVPFVLVSPSQGYELKQSDSFALCNVAPTILDIMGIEKPAEMTAESMLARQTSPLSR